METKHTRGPWAAKIPDHLGGSRVYTAGKSGALIATPGYMRDASESEANARLIAAAPELLEACIRMVGSLKVASPDGENHPDVILARAAIAKATQFEKAG